MVPQMFTYTVGMWKYGMSKDGQKMSPMHVILKVGIIPGNFQVVNYRERQEISYVYVGTKEFF